MAAASEPYDGEFFGQLDRLRQALERFDSATRKLASGDNSPEVKQGLMGAQVVWQSARIKLEDLASVRARARGAALIAAAAELNPSGSTSSAFGKPYENFEHPWTSWTSSTSQTSRLPEAASPRSREIQRLADGPVASLLPAAWLQASARHSPIQTDLIEINPRAAGLEVGGGYSPAGTPYARQCTGSPDIAHLEILTRVHTPENIRARIVLHEMCHRMEDAVPGLIEHEREHHRNRLPGAWDSETREPITELNHEENAQEAQDASPPFFDEYLKRRYTPESDAREAYEILSMSVENLFFGPRPGLPTDLSEDPDTERFVLSLLLGSLTSMAPETGLVPGPDSR